MKGPGNMKEQSAKKLIMLEQPAIVREESAKELVGRASYRKCTKCQIAENEETCYCEEEKC